MYYHVIDFYFSKKSPINKHVGAHVYAHVMHTRVCVRVWVVGGGLPHHSLLCLNEAAAQLVRIPEVTICMQYIVHLQIAPDGAFIKHTRLMSAWTFIQDYIEQPPKVKILC